MIEVLADVLTYVTLAAAAWAAVLVIVNKPVELRRWHGLGLYGALILVEVGLLAQLVAGIVRVVNENPPIDKLTFVGYLVGTLVVLPLAGFWGLVERTRWGPAVLVVGCLTVPVLIVRLHQIWAHHV